MPPELEKITADFKEMDISLGDYVWEVKPGYAAYSSFLNSINKYVNNYSRTKLQSEYTTDNGLHIPGGFVPTKTINLFSIYNIKVMMSVVYQGPGRIGYFFQIKCKEKNAEDNNYYRSQYDLLI